MKKQCMALSIGVKQKELILCGGEIRRAFLKFPLDNVTRYNYNNCNVIQKGGNRYHAKKQSRLHEKKACGKEKFQCFD